MGVEVFCSDHSLLNMYQILPLFLRSQGVPILHNHWIVESLFAKLSGMNGFIDIVKSTQVIAFFSEVDVGNPFSAAFV